jgi:hypothetical protein
MAMTVYTAAQAAAVCQVSLRTVQRKTSQLEAAGAWKDATGQWCIPIEAMRAVGLSPGRPSPPDKRGDNSLRQPANSLRQPVTGDLVSQLRAEMAAVQLRAETEIAEWRRRAEVAEAQAAERERIIETQQMALRMLDAAPPPPALPVWQQPAGFLARLLRF